MEKRRLACNGKCSAESAFNISGCVLSVSAVRVHLLKPCEEVGGWSTDREPRLKTKMGWRGMAGRSPLAPVYYFLGHHDARVVCSGKRMIFPWESAFTPEDHRSFGGRSCHYG